MVGHGVRYDDIEELSCIKNPTMRTFFHSFNIFSSEKVHPDHVYIPSTLKDIMEREEVYAGIGIPSACGLKNAVYIQP